MQVTDQYSSYAAVDAIGTGFTSSPLRSRAFDLEVVSLIPSLRRFARGLCANRTLAEDLVQEACASAMAHSNSFVPGTNMRAWLFTILRNRFYTTIRARTHEVQDAEGGFAAKIRVSANQNPSADLRDAFDAMDVLTPGHREMLLLIGCQGFTYDEAAALGECPVGTVKSRTHRARRELIRLLG